ncbi:hypothetical protein EVA_21476, partial [gut metagenome]
SSQYAHSYIIVCHFIYLNVRKAIGTKKSLKKVAEKFGG